MGIYSKMTSVGVNVVDNLQYYNVTALSNKLELNLYFVHGIPQRLFFLIFTFHTKNVQNVYSIVNFYLQVIFFY